MGKKEIVSALAVELGTTKKAAGEAYDAFIAVTQNAIAEGNDVNLSGLVAFKQKEVPAHEKVVHFTGAPETITVPARTKVTAKASKTLTR